MELGGLMMYAFKAFLGNPDIMITLLTWAVVVTLVLVVLRFTEKLRD